VTPAAAISHPGIVRTGNEDAYILEPELGLFAVADGMGGHNGGEVASKLTVETVATFIRTSRDDPSLTWPFGLNLKIPFEANQLATAVQLANRQVRDEADRRPELRGMGSTLIAVLVRGGRAHFANVGDSRLYLWRHDMLTQLSQDDSWAASMIRAGASEESVRNHQMRHMLTRAIGSAPALIAGVSECPLEAGDVLLLCSDGLYGPLGESGIAEVIGRTTAGMVETATALVGAANAAGGPDNVTVVLVRIDAETAGHATEE
jgi:serine/threonine protein phosphatase PrpC